MEGRRAAYKRTILADGLQGRVEKVWLPFAWGLVLDLSLANH